MFTGLKTDSLTISRLLGGQNAFSVPPYQRGYSWTTREVGQLLDDISSAAGIQDAHGATPDYFLGTVLLLGPPGGVPREDEEGADAAAPGWASGNPPFDVVDGQQRLITLSLLVAVLAGLVEDTTLATELRAMLVADSDGCPRITGCEDERIVIEAIVMRAVRGASASSAAEATAESPHAGAASEDRSADGLPPPRTDDGEGKSLLMGAYRYLRQELSALSPADQLALARYLKDFCHVVIIITRDIDRAHLLFTVLNDRGRPLQRKDILKVEVLKLIAVDEEARALARWDAAAAKLGNDFESLFSHIRTIHSGGRTQIIQAMRSLVRQHGSDAFLADLLTPMADAFHLIRRFSEQPQRCVEHPELAAALTSLNRFSHADWVAPAMLAMSRFEHDPAAATRIVVEIDRLTFLLKVLALGGAKRSRRTTQVINALRRGVEHEIDAAFAFTREEARSALHHLKDIHRRNPSLAKLILMRIEDEMRGAPLLLSTSELTVEHVLPQRPAATSQWRKVFASAEVRETCQNSLGNLALVPPRVNERLKNREFAEKSAMLAGLHTGSDPVLMTNEDIVGASEWTPEHVTAREERLLAILTRLWRLDGGAAAGGPTPTPPTLPGALAATSDRV